MPPWFLICLAAVATPAAAATGATTRTTGRTYWLLGRNGDRPHISPAPSAPPPVLRAASSAGGACRSRQAVGGCDSKRGRHEASKRKRKAKGGRARAEQQARHWRELFCRSGTAFRFFRCCRWCVQVNPASSQRKGHARLARQLASTCAVRWRWSWGQGPAKHARPPGMSTGGGGQQEAQGWMPNNTLSR
jgi:hypothetical protein